MAVKGILCIELSVLLLCYKLCKSQADTCTVFLGAFPAVEAFKKMGQVFFMKPFSPVRKTYFRIERIFLPPYPDLPACRRMLRTVFEQIENRLLRPLSVSLDVHGFPGCIQTDLLILKQLQ